ncbi:hypothetical protein K491DRAFT_685393 [Lophiostoma macrostomum CBS 122681]|uniref:RING-type domain-containing protein n=1 Tax=Lophiostoma macrostomum CBS 122681 TaxID=1314788 RepID=A0A6A6SIJ0_9PLEO|nr:hypothetical protein K491DRAFT_685393 [Lophiostoma macrostomum CBS 122681]
MEDREYPNIEDLVRTHIKRVSKPKDRPDCPICLRPWGTLTLKVVQTECGHVYHQYCLIRWLKAEQQITITSCPICRGKLSQSCEMTRRNASIDASRNYLREVIHGYSSDNDLSTGGYSAWEVIRCLALHVWRVRRMDRGPEANLSFKAAQCYTMTVFLQDFGSKMAINEWVNLLVQRRHTGNDLTGDDNLFVWDGVIAVYRFRPEVVFTRSAPPKKVSVTIWNYGAGSGPFEWKTLSYGSSETVDLGGDLGRLLLPSRIDDAIRIEQRGRSTLNAVGVFPEERMIKFKITPRHYVGIRFIFWDD